MIGHMLKTLDGVEAELRELLAIPARYQKRFWTAEEERLLRQLYPDMLSEEIAKRLGRRLSQVYQHAAGLGLKKSKAYMDTHPGGFDGRIGEAHRFPKGHPPWNKGKKLGSDWGGENSKRTRFKKGQKPWDWVPIGSTRTSKDGYLQRKVADTGYPPTDWKGEHTIIWEKRHGKVPKDHCLRFRNGNKKEIRLGNLKLITRAENRLLNSVHRMYPKEIAMLFMAKARLTRVIRDKEGRKK